MSEFRMPSLGADMDEGTLVEWLKQPGEKLSRGDVVAVVETQKGAIEIEVFQDGLLETIHVKPGTKVPVGTVLATIRSDGETPAKAEAPPAPLAAAPVTVASREAEPVAVVAPGSKVTPAARRSAARQGLDLLAVKPGPDGVIGLREVESATSIPRPRVAGIDLDEMRKAIAAAMARSKRDIPHYYVSSDIDVTAMSDWLAAENGRRAVPQRLLAAVPIIKACALGLRQVRELNGRFVDGRFVAAEDVRMGIGIALRGGGLIAPALPHPDRLPLDDIMQRLADLVARVRRGRLRSSELTDATVTLSNLGDGTADAVLPVIYPPQVAIVGVGQIVERPWVANGTIAIRRIATFSVAGDHRASDGRAAARFLAAVTELMQKPEAL